MSIKKKLGRIKVNYSLVIIFLGIIAMYSCNQNINQNMNTIEDKIKKIASWQSPDQYISTDAVVTSNHEVLLLNSSNYYFSMSPSASQLTKHDVSKELVRVEQMDKDNYLILTYEEENYVCYKSNSLDLLESEVVNLGEDATEIAYNESTNSIWFISTSKELLKYDFASKSSTKLSDLNLKNVYLSNNNEYVAFEGVDNTIYFGDAKDVHQIKEHQSDKNTELLGITNNGDLVLLELGLAEKGGNNQNMNTLVLVKGSDRKVLIPNCNYNWAILQGKHIVASSNNGTITFLELSM